MAGFGYPLQESQYPGVTRPGPTGMPAIAFFREAGKPCPRWLRVLKPGFRHCGLILELDPRLALVLESSNRGLAIAMAWASMEALAPVLDGARTIDVTIVHPGDLDPQPLPVALFTCVELVKRALGIRDRFVLTPYQLYRHLGGLDA